MGPQDRNAETLKLQANSLTKVLNFDVLLSASTLSLICVLNNQWIQRLTYCPTGGSIRGFRVRGILDKKLTG